MPLVTIDNSAPHEVASELLQPYLAEQMRLRQWQLVSSNWNLADQRVYDFECLDAEGGEHKIEVMTCQNSER